MGHVIRVVAAVIERDGRYLIAQRQKTAVLPLLWEFPGGRVEADESDEDALVREVRGRIDAAVKVQGVLGEHTHDYDGYEVHLTLFACVLDGDAEPSAASVADIRWVTSTEMTDYEFPPADQSTMDKLLGVKRWPES
ncbi:MAG TPA: (deoxy)nucleoside triphosphate pyrophosphohydrolase [Kofleriaceae bacterium]|nr:(deoxy)nucleoside triphosphate pyrophosphohydrolase [Kofleriaceae bacterium]